MKDFKSYRIQVADDKDKRQASQIMPESDEQKEWETATGARDNLSATESATVFAGSSNPELLMVPEAQEEYKAMQLKGDAQPNDYEAKTLAQLKGEATEDKRVEEADTTLMQESDLTTNPEWLDSARSMFKIYNGEDFDGTDQELSEMGLDMVSDFNWNIPNTIKLGLYNPAKYGTEYAQALTKMLDIYDQTEWNSDSFWRAIGGIAADPTTYIGLGVGKWTAGKVMTQFAKSKLKDSIKTEGSKRLIQAGSGLAAAGASEGGLVSAGVEATRQSAEKSAGTRDEMDYGRVATTGATGAAAGAIFGMTLGGAFGLAAAKWKGRGGRNSHLPARREVDPEDMIANDESRTDLTVPDTKVSVEGREGIFTVAGKGHGWIEVRAVDGVITKVRAGSLTKPVKGRKPVTRNTEAINKAVAEVDDYYVMRDQEPPYGSPEYQERLVKAQARILSEKVPKDKVPLEPHEEEAAWAQAIEEADDWYLERGRTPDYESTVYEKMLNRQYDNAKNQIQSQRALEQVQQRAQLDADEKIAQQVDIKSKQVDRQADRMAMDKSTATPMPTRTMSILARIRNRSNRPGTRTDTSWVPVAPDHSTNPKHFFMSSMSTAVGKIAKEIATRKRTKGYRMPHISAEDEVERVALENYLHKKRKRITTEAGGSTVKGGISRYWSNTEVGILFNMLEDQSLQMHRFANDIKSRNDITPDEIVMWTIMRSRFSATEALLSGVSTGPVGQFSQFQGYVDGMNPMHAAEMIRNYVRDMSGNRGVLQHVKLVAEGDGSAASVSDRVGKDTLQKSIQELMAIRYNFMLKSWRTHVANNIGNLGVAINEQIFVAAGKIAVTNMEFYARRGIRKIPSMRLKVAPEEEAQRMTLAGWKNSTMGMFGSTGDALSKFAIIMEGGIIPDSPIAYGGKVSVEAGLRYDPHAVPEYFGGKVITSPVRLLEASDAVFKTWAFNGHLYGQAEVKARTLAQPTDGRGFRVPDDWDFNQRMDYWVNNPSEGMVNAANLQAQRMTFTNNPEDVYGSLWAGLATSLSNLQNSSIFFQTLMPFVRSPMNIMGYAGQHAGISGPTYKAIAKGTPTERADAITRLTIAAGLWAYVDMLYEDGKIAGEGHPSWDVNRTREALGIRNNSVRIGDTWVKLDRVDPWAMTLNIMATGLDAFSYAENPEEMTSVVASGIFEVADMAIDRSSINTVSQFLTAVKDNNLKYGASILAASVGSYVIPNVTRDVREATDPVVRTAAMNPESSFGTMAWQRMTNQLWNALPLTSRDVAPKILWDGTVQVKGGTPLWRSLVPIEVNEAKVDPATSAILYAQVPIPEPGHTISLPSPNGLTVSLNLSALDDEGWVYTAYKIAIGKNRKEFMDRFIDGEYSNYTSDDQIHGPNSLAAQRISETIQSADKMTRQTFLHEYLAGKDEITVRVPTDQYTRSGKRLYENKVIKLKLPFEMERAGQLLNELAVEKYNSDAIDPMLVNKFPEYVFKQPREGAETSGTMPQPEL